jgi:MoxR-like ATPase
MVIATQNPLEHQGTYPLPEAQLDRFLFKIDIAYPDRAQEIGIVRRHGNRPVMPRLRDFDLQPVAGAETLSRIRAAVEQVTLSDPLVEYVVDLVRSTRENSLLEFGASTRAANMLASAARAFALLQARDFVIPDDIKTLALPTLRHRIAVTAAAEIEGRRADDVLRETLERIPAPR